MLAHEYLDQVFYETLRLHPPLAIFNRECSEQISLEGAKGKQFVVKKDFSLMIPVWSIQRDPGDTFGSSHESILNYFRLDYFPNPEEFIPERFDPEFGGSKAFFDRGVLLPFGDGDFASRICYII